MPFSYELNVNHIPSHNPDCNSFKPFCHLSLCDLNVGIPFTSEATGMVGDTINLLPFDFEILNLNAYVMSIIGRGGANPLTQLGN